MKKINVTLFNVHGPTNSHIELECECEGKYYTINRWDVPTLEFDTKPNLCRQLPSFLCSTFSFEIKANPDDIVLQWNCWYLNNQSKASILSNNCADATLWFLERFAGVPSDAYETAPTTVNHLAFGIPYPSFFKRRVTLPGRVMDIAKAHFATPEEQLEKQASSGFEPEQWGCLVGASTFFKSLFEEQDERTHSDVLDRGYSS